MLSTPTGYLRFSHAFPKRKFVGILSCQSDPLLQRLETVVVSIKEAAGVENGNKQQGQKKKDKKASSPSNNNLWEVILEDTVIFPEGGGQPSDTGTLTLKDNNEKKFSVVRSERRGLEPIHIVQDAKGLSPGDVVTVENDFERRWDHMTQHTGQHLLSGVLEKVFGIPTLSWSLTPYPNPCYIEIPRAPTTEEVQKTISRCNELIINNTQVHVDVSPLVEEGERPTKMPQDYRASTSNVDNNGDKNDNDNEAENIWQGGAIRNVTIQGLEVNPCCGSHMPNLAYLQMLHVLPQTSSIRGTNVRLYFMVGKRCQVNLATSLESSRKISNIFACSQDDIVERVDAVSSEKTLLSRKLRKLKEDSADKMSQLIRMSNDNYSLCNSFQSNPVSIRLWHGKGDEENLEYLVLLNAKLTEYASEEQEIWIYLSDTDGAILINSINPQQQQDASLLEGLIKQIAEPIKQTLDIKGGGKGKWQGKRVQSSPWSEKDESSIRDIVSKLAAEKN